MITLAFNQIVCYFGVDVPNYGGEDGLQIIGAARSRASTSQTASLFYYLVPLLLRRDIFLSGAS